MPLHDHFRLRMKLVNEVINYLNANKNDRERRHNHQQRSVIHDKYEEIAKAFDWMMDKDKQYRYRRETISAKNKMQDILNSFKQARNELQKEYEWKYYNISNPWSNKTDEIYDISHNSTTATKAPSSTHNPTCVKEMAISSSIFGTLILCFICLTKIFLRQKEKNPKNSEQN